MCVLASVPSVPTLISLAHVVCGLDELHTFSVSKKRDVSVTLERGAEESESKHGNDTNPIGVQSGRQSKQQGMELHLGQKDRHCNKDRRGLAHRRLRHLK